MTILPIKLPRRPSLRGGLFVGVALAHGALVATLAQAVSSPTPPAVLPITVSLLTPPVPEPQAQRPRPTPPKPAEAPKPVPKKVVKAPRVKTTPKPVAKPVPPPEPAPQTVTEPEPLPEPPTEQVALAEPAPRPADPLPVTEPVAEEVPETAPLFDAAYLKNPKPDYPRLSKRLGEEGTVLLRVLVTANGLAAEVEVRDSSGFERLDKQAMKAVRDWKFVPAKRGNAPTEAWVNVPVAFNLNG